MATKLDYKRSQLFNLAENSYLERTSQPIYSLIFLLPFIVFYEMGTILTSTDVLNRTQDRVVAFVWLQSFLDKYIGLDAKLAWAAPPVVVILILLALQLASRKGWHFTPADFGPMTVECILLAVPLIVLSLFLSGPATPTGNAALSGMSQVVCRMSSHVYRPSLPAAAVTSSGALSSRSLLADVVTGIGAGIYEELIFRLILMCLLMVLLQDLLGLSHKGSITLSVFVSAALFSAHHHVVFVNGHLASNSPFSWREFGFRTTAGVYFAVLFAIRGFGITAGSHAFYDIIATLINAAFFQC